MPDNGFASLQGPGGPGLAGHALPQVNPKLPLRRVEKLQKQMVFLLHFSVLLKAPAQ